MKRYHIDESEFLEPVDSFRSFNDFFIRKLRPSARPIHPAKEGVILPADGRYLAYQQIGIDTGFAVKGGYCSVEHLLCDTVLAQKYEGGSLVIARLAPVDYHRFHFPVDSTPSETILIDGPLFSVNPIALQKHRQILTHNKRALTRLETSVCGTVVFVEVGATYVGTIHQTFTPYHLQSKGTEKGYFSFGGSCVILLFEPGTIQIESDLLEATRSNMEVFAHFGQLLGSLK